MVNNPIAASRPTILRLDLERNGTKMDSKTERIRMFDNHAATTTSDHPVSGAMYTPHHTIWDDTRYLDGRSDPGYETSFDTERLPINRRNPSHRRRGAEKTK